jgi:stage II sporulation protein D
MKRRIKHSVLTVLMLLLVGGLTSFYVPVENIHIRLFAHLKVNAFQIILNKGNYKVLADGNLMNEIKINDVFSFTIKSDSVEVKRNDQWIGVYKYLKFVSDTDSELKIKLLEPDRKIRIYQDNIALGVSDGVFRIINEVGLDNYISGVTEAEAGSKAALEFYKVQAILARTFALVHINKHITEGYNLCDQVHCQAYYGKPKDLSILRAVDVTRGKVVVDENLNLIIAAFHSNSGGQTANSEDVWGSHTSYLRSIRDTFSVKMPNARWERKMLTDDWLSYLKLKHNYPIEKAEAKSMALNFNQDTRKIFLEASDVRVPLKNVRTDLQLKSTFFSIHQYGSDSVIFSGRGYGHGLGMCQEGAMRMVKLGYSYTDVLNFYYQNIQLIDLHKLNFFKDE